MNTVDADYSPGQYIHGYKYYKYSISRSSKLFWIGINVIALYFFAKQSNDVVVTYLMRTTVLSQEVNFKESAKLPDVQICIYIKYDPDKMIAMNYTEKMHWVADWAFFSAMVDNRYIAHHPNFGEQGWHFADKMPDIVKMEKVFEATGRNLYSDSMNMFYECSDLVERCIIGGIASYNCCDGATQITTSYGRCFIITAKHQYLPGFSQRQDLVLKLPGNRFKRGKFAGKQSWNSGFLIQFRSSNTTNFNSGHSLIPQGFHTTIALRRKTYCFLNTRHGRCISNDSYSQKDCQVQCYDMPSTMCNCTTIDIIETWKGKYDMCPPSRFISCYFRQLNEWRYNSSAILDQMSICNARCPKECEQHRYDKYFSMTKLAMPKQGSSYVGWDRNTTILAYYLEATTDDVNIEYYQMNSFDLIGHLGNAICCWGVNSILTIVHLFVMVLKTIWVVPRIRTNSIVATSGELII